MAAVTFEAASDQIQFHETISRYRADAARDLMAQARDLPEDCATFTDGEGDSKVTLETSALDFPTLLDDAVALRIEGRVAATVVSFDQIFLRHEGTVMILVHGGAGEVDTELTEELARIAVDKLSRDG